MRQAFRWNSVFTKALTASATVRLGPSKDRRQNERQAEIFRPVRFALYLRVARLKRSVGMSRRPSDSHALRTSELATFRQKFISIARFELFW
jgi:hypothetical protein